MKAKILVVTMLTIFCITGCNTDTKTVTKGEETTTKKVVERTTDKASEATEEVTIEEVTTEEETTTDNLENYQFKGHVAYETREEYLILK